MEAARHRVGSIACIVTIASFVGSLSISWRIWHARSSLGVAFSPLATNIICLHAWLLCGLTSDNTNVVRVSAGGLVVTAVNATVHRMYSSCTGPGLALLAALLVMSVTSPMVTMPLLVKMASACAVACHLAPIVRVLTFPLPEIAAFTLAACGLWTAYGVLDGNVAMIVNNLVGAIVAAVELCAAGLMYMYCQCGEYLSAQTA
ncbi:hypothetical protein HPB50_023705 [Hyalomma asiaticum]|uniref:Uncharacterized protein n=1 Tax=Hyalomma asiaticum TaxID=266040 RepID=A0ACB7T3Z1_HYAAI|nr:hypothetical protein HPB50_023705 [Hyalomma asiaticum]